MVATIQAQYNDAVSMRAAASGAGDVSATVMAQYSNTVANQAVASGMLDVAAMDANIALLGSELVKAQAAAEAANRAAWGASRWTSAKEQAAQAKLQPALAAQAEHDAALRNWVSGGRLTVAQKLGLKRVELKPGKEAALELLQYVPFGMRQVESTDDAVTQQSSGLPTWAYVLGGLAVVGAAVWLGRK
ncbi:MAG: hypothetical protein WC700_18250 [Gemmatimonadaceae bacterium]